MMIRANVREKNGEGAISEFPKSAASAISYVMNRNFIFFFAAFILIALAACGKGDDEKAAAEKEQPVAPAAQPVAEEKVGPNLLQQLQDNAGVLTEEQKAAVVQRAGANAQSAAAAVGQSAEQAQAAGANAEAAAKRSLQASQPAQ